MQTNSNAYAVTEELRLAQEFLAGLADPRAPWADRFTTWAQERGLGADLARTVKVTVLRLRTFGAIAKHERRRHR